MGLLSGLENIKYASIISLIKNEEPYDKNQRVISGLEVFYLCHKRYELLQSVLIPIKNLLGEDITIISINCNSVNQDETVVTIKYLVNDKLNLMTISISDLEVLDVALSDRLIDNEAFLEVYRETISKIIYELEKSEYFDNIEISLKSSSKKFIMMDNYNDFMVRSSDEKMFSVGTNHYLYDKEKNLYLPDRIISDNEKLKEMLMDEEVVKKIYGNLRIYEEDMPKILIK